MSSGSTLTQYLQNPKSNFPAKYVYIKYICLAFNRQNEEKKKAKTISVKVFKIMEFKNIQQETTKSTLRPYLISHQHTLI